MAVAQEVRKFVETLVWIVEGKHASTVGVFFFGMATAWYLGDSSITGMPPDWMLFVIAGAFTYVVYVLNYVTWEVRQEIVNG